MPGLEHDRFCDEIVAQTDLLTDVSGADLSVMVPTTPDWTLAALVRHIGGNLLARAGRPHRHGRHRARAPGPRARQPAGDDPATLDVWLSEAAGRCAATAARPGRRPGPGLDGRVAGRHLGPPRRPRPGHPPRRRRRRGRRRLHRRPGPGRRRPGRVPRPDEHLGVAEAAAADGDPSPGGTVHLHATDTGPEVASERWRSELASSGFTWRQAHDQGHGGGPQPIADVLRVAYRRLPPDTEASRSSATVPSSTPGWSGSSALTRRFASRRAQPRVPACCGHPRARFLPLGYPPSRA